MTREELINEIKRKIDDEIKLQGEYYTGRKTAFEYVLSLMEDESDNKISRHV